MSSPTFSSLPIPMKPIDPKTLLISTVDPPIDDHDLPPQSFQIPVHDVLHWFKPSKLLDREPSTIGNANPKSGRTKSRSPVRSNPAGSIRPPNGPIPGLANSGFNFAGNRPRPNLRIFPVNFSEEKRRSSPDPGSPKVSCFGSVLLEKERRVGCWGNFLVAFGLAGVFPAVSGEAGGDGGRRKYLSGEEECAPELQGMKRFSSRRREVGDVDVTDCVHVVSLEPLDRERPLRK